jgi:hypothetical protein
VGRPRRSGRQPESEESLMAIALKKPRSLPPLPNASISESLAERSLPLAPTVPQPGTHRCITDFPISALILSILYILVKSALDRPEPKRRESNRDEQDAQDKNAKIILGSTSQVR